MLQRQLLGMLQYFKIPFPSWASFYSHILKLSLIDCQGRTNVSARNVNQDASITRYAGTSVDSSNRDHW